MVRKNRLTNTAKVIIVIGVTVLVLGGIFMLRNRLAGKDKLEQEEIQKPASMSRRHRSGKQARITNKISIRHKIENEFISKSWIGAG